jgi:hypothetical protein
LFAAPCPYLFAEGAVIHMEELLERVQTSTVDTESCIDYPTPEEEEAAYAIPLRIAQPVQRQEPRSELAGCVPALWERWHVERSCRNRGRRNRFAGR